MDLFSALQLPVHQKKIFLIPGPIPIARIASKLQIIWTDRRFILIHTDWPQEDAEALGPAGTNNDHLWEESWDDDDSSEEFSKQLKYVWPPKMQSARGWCL